MTNHLVAMMSIVAVSMGSANGQEDERWSASARNVRVRFAEDMQRVHGEFAEEPPSTMAEVRTILGEPDDVVTEEDRHMWPGHVIWCYGASGHLSLPTLGAVCFDDTGKARWIMGADPVTPAADLPTEPELRDLLRLVDRVQMSYTDPTFNPRDMIAVVNTLRQLEKRRVLGVLREYSRIQSTMSFDGGAGAIIVMRFLFSVPNGEVHHTTYLPFEEYKSPEVPAFPAVVIEGVPLYLFPLGGWGMGGGLPGVDEYLDWYAKHGELIQQALTPADDPRAVWNTWEQGLRKVISAADPGHAAAADELVMAQMLRMIDTVHPRQFDEDDRWSADEKRLWTQATAVLEATPTRWDAKAGRYVRAHDGSSIDPVRETQYVRVIWELPIEGRRARLVLERSSDDKVRVAVEQDAHDSPAVPSMKVRVFVSDDAERQLSSLELKGDFTSGNSSTSSQIRLAKGMRLRAQLVHDKKVIAESDLLDVDRKVQRGD